ncbi:hypothetical protein M569_03381, partial [Genlisea aurea]
FSSKKLNRDAKTPKSRSGSSSAGSPLSVIPPKKRGELDEVFRHFDANSDGKISASELRSYFASIGDHMSLEDAELIIGHFDRDGDNQLCFQDFKRMMEEENDRDADLMAAFGVFEVERGSGRITPRSLQRALRQLGDPKSYDDCVAMIGVFDSDGKGELGYGEFHRMMA